MGKIVVSSFVSLDGVVQDPDGAEGLPFGGWVGRVTDSPELSAAFLDEAQRAGALLLGRRSYEFFAARWAPRSGVLADRLNGLPHYVVSATLHDPGWGTTTVLTGDVADAVAPLRRLVDGDIVVYASARLVRTLLAHYLVDELRLTVVPVVLGAGARLFGPAAERTPLRLVGARVLDSAMAVLTYAPSAPG